MAKIIYLIECLNRSGGTERVVSLKANWLVEHGYEVTILTTIEKEICSFYPLSEKIKLYALHIDNLADVRKQQSRKDALSSLKNIFISFRRHWLLKKKLSEYIKENPCDYLSTLIHCGFIPKMKDGSKKIYEIHNLILNVGGHDGRYIYRLIASLRKCYQSRTYKNYYRIVDLTEEDVVNRGNLSNMIVVPNFITVNIPSVKSQLNSKRVISVGRLHFEKGFDFLFAAWALVARKYPDWHLDIYGGVDEDKGKDYFQQLVNDNGVKDFISLNDPVKNIVDKYVESSFYIMSSRNEGFPLVLLEAMACGLPCVSYDCGDPREIIAHGEDGLLVDKVGDVEGLAKAMIYMIEHPEERKRMGQNAERNVQRFSIDNVMSKWVEVLK